MSKADRIEMIMSQFISWYFSNLCYLTFQISLVTRKVFLWVDFVSSHNILGPPHKNISH